MKHDNLLQFLFTTHAFTFARCLSPQKVHITPLEILYDSTNNLHRDMQYHPEQPKRIEACIHVLQKFRGEQNDGLNLFKNKIEIVDVSTTSSPKDILSIEDLRHAREMLVGVHSEEYVSLLEQKCRDSKKRRLEEGKNPLGFIGYVDTGDTFLTTESYDVCLRATAIWIRAVDLSLGYVKNGGDITRDFSKRKIPFALTRPPGHHATRTLSNGFCLFNFATAAAYHATEHRGADRVSILDWDVHYGQGIANIIQNEPKIRYVSMHQTPAFPYEGEELKVIGTHGNVFTVPVNAGSTWQKDYRDVFKEKVLPFVSDGDEWIPDVVIVSAGYDALAVDDLASVNLEPEDYGEMAKLLREWVTEQGGESAEGPGLLLGLEGGYQLRYTGHGLTDAVLETVKALI